VSTILSLKPNDYLMKWAAETAALRAAEPLVQAGLYVPDDYMRDRLARFVHDRAVRPLTPDEAILEACDWQSNSVEHVRYRDDRADEGSIMHQGLFEYALGVWDGSDPLAYCMVQASQPRYLPESKIERYAALGKTVDEVVAKLAHNALPHLKRALAVVRALDVEWHSADMECVVVNTDEQYAGTADAFGVVTRKKCEAAGVVFPFRDRDVALVEIDYKATNSLPRSVRYQMAAYARAEFIGDVKTGETREVPDVDGLLCLWLNGRDLADPAADVHKAVHFWADTKATSGEELTGREAIDRLFDAFCYANAFYRSDQDLPVKNSSRAFKARKPAVAKRGFRTCPI
jgi:hypothetical protein